MSLSTITPVLRIFDEAKAREFYVDFLGFSVDWEHRFDEDFPVYLGISRDDCLIHLTEHHGDATPGAAVRIKADDVNAYNRELLDRAYKYAKPGVKETPWETSEMTITDPFGNRLTIYEISD
jgi:catechol 2,3-dioxygenase-like lactoylglutathione lyase family enzyme